MNTANTSKFTNTYNLLLLKNKTSIVDIFSFHLRKNEEILATVIVSN